MAEGCVVFFLVVYFAKNALGNGGSPSSQRETNWEKQFAEMKLMLSGLDLKMASMEGKINHLNVLDYAFKMNTIDNQIRSLNTRMDQILTHVDFVKDAVQALKIPTCLKITESQANDGPRSASIVNQENGFLRGISDKLDNYGKKLIQSHQNLSQIGLEQRTALGMLSDMARSGFSKVIAKLDLSLELEGQVSNAINILQGLTAKASDISENVAEFARDILNVKSTVSASQNMLNNLTKDLKEVSGKAHEVAAPISDLTRAMQLGNDLEAQIAQLTSIDQKISKATDMSKRLLSEAKEGQQPEFHEETEKLNSLLNEIENVSLPVFLSVPYLFQNLQAVVGDALITLRNRTRCSSNQAIQLEVKRLRDSINQTLAKTEELEMGSTGKDPLANCMDKIQLGLQNDKQYFTTENFRKFAEQVSELDRKYNDIKIGSKSMQALGLLLG